MLLKREERIAALIAVFTRFPGTYGEAFETELKPVKLANGLPSARPQTKHP
jgi:hypothetical protein